MNPLLENLAKLHTTKLGMERIKRNLKIETNDVVHWCREKILEPDAVIERAGKNWYITTGPDRITAHSYTIITAHKAKKGV